MVWQYTTDTSRVTIASIPTVTSDFEILYVVMEIESKFVLLALVYKPPLLNENTFIYQLQIQLDNLLTSKYTFIYQLQMQLDNLLTSKYWAIVVRDFDMDQLLYENVAAFQPMIN